MGFLSIVFPQFLPPVLVIFTAGIIHLAWRHCLLGGLSFVAPVSGGVCERGHFLDFSCSILPLVDEGLPGHAAHSHPEIAFIVIIIIMI